MANIFQTVLSANPQSNSFDLSHDRKMSLSMGRAVPACVLEAVPGDRFNIDCEVMARFPPLISPLMHQVNIQIHYFFVPNRILWSGWEDWITGVDTVSSWPYLGLDGTQNDGSLADYLGYPDRGGSGAVFASCLPVAAYLKIYDEYYRDQNLISGIGS